MRIQKEVSYHPHNFEAQNGYFTEQYSVKNSLNGMVNFLLCCYLILRYQKNFLKPKTLSDFNYITTSSYGVVVLFME